MIRSVATIADKRRVAGRPRPRWDPWLLGCVVALVGVGLVMVYSASISSAERTLGNSFYYFVRQLGSVVVGCILMYLVMHTPLRLWERAGPYLLMLVTASLLGVCLIFPNLINRNESLRGQRAHQAGATGKPLAKGGAFKLVIGKRYLLLIAALMMISNVVNTTGEFILGKSVTQEAQRFASSTPAPAPEQAAAAASAMADFSDSIGSGVSGIGRGAALSAGKGLGRGLAVGPDHDLFHLGLRLAQLLLAMAL